MMWKRILPLLVFAAATALLLVGLKRFNVLESVTPAPAVHIVTDITHDVDRLGLAITRVSEEKEMEIGDGIASTVPFALAGANDPTQAYLKRVGDHLAAVALRKGIRYRFHYVPDPSLVNAFAIPVGHVYVGAGLLELLQSEAELASVLGHEIQHVDQRHTIEHLQYELAARRLGLGNLSAILQLGTALFQQGYSKDLELDADRISIQMCAQLGYRPSAMADLFRRMEEKYAHFEDLPPARTPVGETAQVLAASLEEYFRSHPRYQERIAQISKVSAEYPRKKWIEGREEFLANYHRVASTRTEATQPDIELMSKAEQGDMIAQLLLAQKYESSGSCAEAAEWYRKAAEQGSTFAPFWLAALYEDGHEVPQDYVQAYLWYDVASSRGVSAANDALDRLGRLMTEQQIGEAQALARSRKSQSTRSQDVTVRADH